MTRSGAQAIATYQHVQVTSRSPLELVVMLYDGAIQALRQAHDALDRRDLVTKRATIRKALQIVQHLQSSLNMEDGGEVAANLDIVYRDVITRVLDGNVRLDPAPLRDAIALLETVREAWYTIAAAAGDVRPGTAGVRE
jgi:flagellar protein FliS